MIGTVVVIAFVLVVLGIAAYALFELSPFGRHADNYRDVGTGKLHFEQSPHLETRDEFERRSV
jgi:hypothetical protein